MAIPGPLGGCTYRLTPDSPPTPPTTGGAAQLDPDADDHPYKRDHPSNRQRFGAGRAYARHVPAKMLRGKVTWFDADNGLGELVSDEVPGPVWIHHSVIEMRGMRELAVGQLVDFLFERAHQDTWNYRATWVRPLPAET